MPGPRWLARLNRHVTNKITLLCAGWMPGMAIVHHVGRRSGKSYQTPVLVFRDGEDVVIELTYGSGTDWVKNVLAAGQCELATRRTTVQCSDPRLEHVDRHPWAPAVVRFILRMVHVDEVLRLRREPRAITTTTEGTTP